MKKVKTASLLILILLFNYTGMYAQQNQERQQKTAYEKRMAELTEKYYKIFYGNQQMNMYDKMFFDAITDSQDAKEFILGLGILSYAAKHSEADVKRMVDRVDNDFSQAEKLKTTVDIQREKERKKQSEKKKQDKKLQAEREAYERSDAGLIDQGIKADFGKWAQKGEFEKTEDYEQRMKEQSKNKLVEICIWHIKNNLPKYETYHFTKDLQPYNADGELFNVIFKLNGNTWQNSIKIPIEKAVNFKDDWDRIKVTIDEYNWCYVNSFLCPTLVILSDRNNSYQLPLPLKNQEEISFSSIELTKSYPYLENIYLKYSDLKIIEKRLAQERFEREKRLALEQLEREAIQQENDYRDALYDLFTTKESFIKNMNFQKEMRESAGYTLGRGLLGLAIGEQIPEADYTEENKDRIAALYVINQLRNTSHFIEIIDHLLENNQGLKKEWAKNGYLFDSKEEYYDAYISNDYKKTLKRKRKKQN